MYSFIPRLSTGDELKRSRDWNVDLLIASQTLLPLRVSDYMYMYICFESWLEVKFSSTISVSIPLLYKNLAPQWKAWEVGNEVWLCL